MEQLVGREPARLPAAATPPADIMVAMLADQGTDKAARILLPQAKDAARAKAGEDTKAAKAAAKARQPLDLKSAKGESTAMARSAVPPPAPAESELVKVVLFCSAGATIAFQGHEYETNHVETMVLPGKYSFTCRFVEEACPRCPPLTVGFLARKEDVGKARQDRNKFVGLAAAAMKTRDGAR